MDEKEKRNKFFYWRYILPRMMLFRMSYGIVFHVINVTIVWGDLVRMIEFLLAIMVHAHALVRCFTLLVYRGDFKRIFDVLEKLHDPRMVPFEVMAASLNRTVRTTTLMTSRGAKIAWGSLVVVSFGMMVNGVTTRSIPFRLWFPYDVHQSPMFEVTLIVTHVLQCFDVMVLAICELTFVSLLMLTVKQFRLLQYKLQNIRGHVEMKIAKRSVNAGTIQVPVVMMDVVGDDVIEGGQGGRLVVEGETDLEQGQSEIERQGSETEMWTYQNGPRLASVEAQREMEGYLRHCVKHHQTLLGLSKEINRVFRLVSTAMIISNAMGGFVFIYITTLAPILDVKVAVFTNLLFYQYLAFLGVCWFGHELSKEAMGVRDAAYDCDWFGASESFKRSLRVIISRSDRPLAIKAAGLSLSMGTFRLICRSAYYSHTLLTKLFHGEKINDGKHKKGR